MTNRELLRAPRDALGPVERQRHYVLRVESTPVPCPACHTPVEAITAAGLDLDQYAFGRRPPEYRCPRCAAALAQVVPVLAAGGPGWHWALGRAWLAERLAQARLYDREHPGEAK